MSAFIDSLESRSANDSKVRATLRRSLAFDPGTFVPAYPYVESFVKDAALNSWRRQVHYLVAGVWAAHWREGRTGPPMSIGEACAVFDGEKRKKLNQDDQRKVSSTETRFVTLLDSDCDQLPHRLRQMIALLKDQPINFDALLKGLLNWNDEDKRTQNGWARDFYRNIDDEAQAEPAPEEEAIP